MLGSIGMPELIIIFVIALIIFGPKKLPELGRSLGRSLNEFKRASNELKNTLEEEVRMEEQKERGAKVYAANCAACHQPNGKGAGTFPALDGSKVVNGPKAGQFNILINGKGAMPKWAGVISDGDIAAVMTYTRNSWGNKTGEVIQTQEIITARGGN